MNDTFGIEDPAGAPTRDEMMSALFANMVVQQTNMALIFLGKAPHPETGQTVLDIEAARMFIDQLEMLEAKTKGNLDKREEGLLKQSLMALRMAFVEAVDRPADTTARSTGSDSPIAPASRPEPQSGPGVAPPIEESDAESRKKFSKKY